VLRHLVLDFNGTIAEDGQLCEGVYERINTLSNELDVHIITADTYGSAQKQIQGTGAAIKLLGAEAQDQQKADYVEQLGAEHCVAIGNGRNDAKMLACAKLGFGVIQKEGGSIKALLASDIIFTSIQDALDLLLHPKRLNATLRNA